LPDDSEETQANSNKAKPCKRISHAWEDTVTNRIIHWDYGDYQICVAKKAIEDGIPEEFILEYFYPDIPAEMMILARELMFPSMEMNTDIF
jgi:type IV secretion system protein VirD4